ncbi:M28 family peptidase [Cellulosimicrobium sp. BIT-GX5]|uniref:M28 family peptidase n=1 Tax=Cellulosimicrobium composti TaxID=2672572 RepID=A0A6N7ZFC2_9MICO|nr:M20/M25/M40 family metallo-hydrolase [Cellulosimicrobium composti]MTG88012.1 M28 family peptidase [Cellulosimicrobium composti]
MRPRTIVPSAAAASLVLAALTAAPVGASPAGGFRAAAEPPPLEDLVTGDAVMDRLQDFQDIADANGGNRAMQTPGYEASAVYVEDTLRAAGYEPERQYFTFDDLVVDELSLTAAGVEVTSDVYPAEYAPDTPDDGVTGPIVQPADDLVQGCTADTWDGVAVEGAVALISRGTCPFADKALYAAQAGAAAVILYNNADGALNPTLGAESDEWVPTVGITQAAGQAILDAIAGGADAVATYDLQTHVEEFETFNVIAQTPGGRDHNVVMVGAHLDGVEDGPGINDNGSGSAAILEVAVQLAAATDGGQDVENAVRFAWWGAEEVGLRGSTHYVADLVENDPAALDDIATYLNFDMVGSPNYIIGVYDANESTYPAPVEVPPGSAETEAVFTDYFDGIDQAWVDTEFSGRSDYQAFIENGIPASGLFTGADGSKTAEEVALFGGTEGIFYDPNYHSPADTIDNVDATALDIMSRAIGHAVASLSVDTFAINGVGNPRVDGIVAESRCLAGTAYVAVRATNGEDEAVALRLVTPFGQRAFGQVAPDANAYQSFNARSSSLDAGTVSVVARLAGGGENHSQTYDAAYEAIDCG